MYYYGGFGTGTTPGNGFRRGIFTSFRQASALTRLIYINIGLFAVITVASIFFLLLGHKGIYYDFLLEWLGVPAAPSRLLWQPWTLFTYMFTHFSFLHLLFNMLWLYWFGNFFLNNFAERQLTGVYLLGGICGALLYVLCYNLFPVFTPMNSWAIGASASVMAIVFAVCTYLPQHRVYVFLIGPVKLIHLAIFTALVDLLSIGTGNAGGHIAHLGGALFGCLFALGMRRQHDWAGWITRPADWLKRNPGTPRRNLHVKYRRPASKMTDREYNANRHREDDRINAILDKISHSGYESLTREEKEILFKSGRH